MLTKRIHPNGLTVLTHPLQETQSVTVLVLFGVGSRYETREVNGVSHFVEHLMFKGTKKRPSTLDISRELDSVGAAFNAFTGKDHTGYYIKLAADKVDLALDILSDMLHNSLFKQEEINRERKVIIEEINMYDDNPMMLIGDLFEQQIWGNQPLGWSIAGPRKNIRNISRAKILNYRNAHYKPCNTVVSVAGNVPRDIHSRIEKAFLKGKKKESCPEYKPVEDKQGSKKILTKFRDVGQVQLAIGMKSYPYEHKLLPALGVLSTILGGSMSSRLFIQVRERKGLCYHIRTETAVYQDTGAFAITSGLDRRRLPMAVEAVMKELRDVKANGVTEAELKQAKEFLKGKLTLEWEDSESIAGWYGKQQLFLGKTKSPEEKLKQTFAVTNDDIKEVAGELFNTNKFRGVLVGPVKDGKSLEKLITV